VSRRLKMLILKVVVSMALIFYLFGIQRIDIAQVGRTLEKADILWMAAALLTLLLGRVITALRWQVLLTAQDIRVSMKTLLFSLFVANFFNLFLPSTIGGDAIRVWDIGKESRRPGTSILIIVIERALGAFALLVIAMLSLGSIYFFAPRFRELYPTARLAWPVIGLFLIMGFGYGVASSRGAWKRLLSILTRLHLNQVSEKSERTGEIWFLLKSKTASFRWSIGLSFFLQINVILYHYFIGRSLNLSIPFLYFCLVVPLVYLVLLFPFSINGIGVRESAFLFFFQGLAASPEAIAFSWLQFFMTLVLGAFGGLIYVVRKGPISAESG